MSPVDSLNNHRVRLHNEVGVLEGLSFRLIGTPEDLVSTIGDGGKV